MNNFNSVPAELRAIPHWVGFQVTPKPDGSGYGKMPVQVKNGYGASSTKAEHWTTFEKAVAALKWNAHGINAIGFAFEGSGICGIDLNHCVGANGDISDFAKGILSKVQSYTEYSPSGTGLHILAKCGQPFGGTGINRPEIEIYQSGRYFTVMGRPFDGSPDEINDCTNEVLSVYKRFNSTLNGVICAVSGKGSRGEELSESHEAAAVSAPNAAGSVADFNDSELLSKIRASKNGAKFDALWRGDFSGYKSQSEADLALCSLLAFWTADDTGRMDRLFQASGLFRPKWNEKHGGQTYGEKTVAQGLRMPHDVYRLPVPKQDGGKPRRKRANLGESVIAEIENTYHLVQTDGKTKRLTNFIIKTERKLVAEDEALYSVTLIGADGRRAEMQLKSSDLASASNIKRRLNERDIGWSFLAGGQRIGVDKRASQRATLLAVGGL
jgi:primase-polymerase (primpol)-like protein